MSVSEPVWPSSPLSAAATAFATLTCDPEPLSLDVDPLVISTKGFSRTTTSAFWTRSAGLAAAMATQTRGRRAGRKRGAKLGAVGFIATY